MSVGVGGLYNAAQRRRHRQVSILIKGYLSVSGSSGMMDEFRGGSFDIYDRMVIKKIRSILLGFNFITKAK